MSPPSPWPCSMGTVDTSKQIADDKQRVAMVLPRILIEAYDLYALRELTDRTEMVRRAMLADLPADLLQWVEERVTQERD